MNTRKFIPAIVMLGFLFMGISTIGAQTITGLEIPQRTEEEKEFYRLAETPDNMLSIEDQIFKYDLLLLISKSYYIENGEIKTSCTEDDFIRVGAKPYFYKIFQDQLEDMNKALKETGLPEEEILNSLKESIKQNMKLEKFASQKLKDLKKIKQ